MSMNLANLFFTPQTSGGATGTSGIGLGKGTGLFAAAPGGNLVDMIFARLLQETTTGQLVPDSEADTKKNTGAENIISVLAPTQNDKEENKGKLQQVHLNHILHKLAHEISATIPDSGTTRENDETIAPGLQKELQNLIARLRAETGGEPTAPADDAAPLTERETKPGPVAVEFAPLSEPQRRSFMAFLNGLLQGIPEESRPTVIKLPPGLLGKVVQHLEFNPELPPQSSESAPEDSGFSAFQAAAATLSADGAETPAPALIATGLSPESLTAFMAELSQRLQQGDSFIVGMVKIMPPQSKQEMIFVPRALVLPSANKNAATATTTKNDVALSGDGGDETTMHIDPLLPLLADAEIEAPQPETAKTPATEQKKLQQNQENPLLALLAALQAEPPQGPAPGQAKKPTPVQTTDSTSAIETFDDHKAEPLLPREIVAQLNALVTGNADTPFLDNGLPAESGFARVLKVLEEAQQKTESKNPVGLGKAVNVIKSMSPALSSFHANNAFPAMGMAFAAALSGDVFPDGWDWSRFDGGAAGHAMTMNSPVMMAASLVSQAPHATTPHPATQIVAATITKAAATGENRNITVRLEPPELGRVEIRMEFGKDKAVKTHIIAEKQETYLMLQRDAHILDRTLQDAGLDTDGGVSFELAQDGGAFDGGRNGQRGASGGSDSADGTEIAEETIEATMDWYVDPDTGLMRYDILA